MSVIKSVSAQFNKAEFAYQLNRYFNEDKIINDLFVGATKKSTICNIIAAMIELPEKIKGEGIVLNDEIIFGYLFQCFYFLFVKEVEHNTLTQAEQLIMSISIHFAKKINQQQNNMNDNLIEKSVYIVKAVEHLEIRRVNNKKSQYNMG
jgi:hypothetical protein